ncbi:MAG: ACT domain-containing protein [Anaerolineae bacterium]|nr:ACT domain-containing protein [Anaerolineae bacterium]
MVSETKIKIGGILQSRGLRLVGLMSAPDRPGLAAAVFEALGGARLNVQFIVQSIDLSLESQIDFCLADEDLETAKALLEPLATQLDAKIRVYPEGVALVSVFGPDFRQRPGIAGAAFGALGKAGINILAISTSISTVSCVIYEKHYDGAIDALQQVFDMP